jgi:hypothetical protein
MHWIVGTYQYLQKPLSDGPNKKTDVHNAYLLDRSPLKHPTTPNINTAVTVTLEETFVGS